MSIDTTRKLVDSRHDYKRMKWNKYCHIFSAHYLPLELVGRPYLVTL